MARNKFSVFSCSFVVSLFMLFIETASTLISTSGQIYPDNIQLAAVKSYPINSPSVRMRGQTLSG